MMPSKRGLPSRSMWMRLRRISSLTVATWYPEARSSAMVRGRAALMRGLVGEGFRPIIVRAHADRTDALRDGHVLVETSTRKMLASAVPAPLQCTGQSLD